MPRRKPFSHKQKKLQLQHKRERKREKGVEPPVREGSPAPPTDDDGSEEECPPSDPRARGPVEVAKLHQQPLPSSKPPSHDPNRYTLLFVKESDEVVERRTYEAKTRPLVPVPEVGMEVSVEDVYRPGSVLDLPKRPAWDYSMSKAQVEAREEAMFAQYLQRIFSQHSPQELSYFEQNLETWRQLWRVLEISNILLLITDARHPVLHFPPALYSHIVDDLGKQVVLVLNKVDLVPPSVVLAWKHYFACYPKLCTVCFTSHPNPTLGTESVKLKRRRKKGRQPSAVGSLELFRVIEDIYKGKVDLSDWRSKVELSKVELSPGFTEVTPAASGEEEDECDGGNGDGEESGGEGGGEEGGEGGAGAGAVWSQARTFSPLVRDDVAKDVITIGLIGHPNVGKSSLLNGVMGRKVVSVSRTPGHTKHFQTIFLSSKVRLCDCPGLVFPSLVDRQLQILSGMFPIAQVREPYSAVGYLASRSPIVPLLRLKHPSSGEPGHAHHQADGRGGGGFKELVECEPWTAWDICDAWAEQRGYRTSRAARLDTYRAANSILRMALEGKISMFFVPPNYCKNKGYWESLPEVKEMIELQRVGMVDSGKGSGGEEGKEEGESGQFQQHMNKFAVLMDSGDM